VIPSEETGVLKDGDVVRAFPVGADVEVQVLEVDATGRRIRLSAKAVVKAKETAELREYQGARGTTTEGFGSLADKLRGALKPRGK
jgi:predicted RNA-binding protein with RPS1 domain